MSDEIVYLDTDDVMVTSTRLVVRAGPQPTIYVIRHITSVGCIEIPPEKPKKPPDNSVALACGLAVLSLLSVCFLTAGIQSLAEGKPDGMKGAICCVTPLLVGIALLIWAIRNPARAPPTPPSTYVLVIRTAGVETQVLFTNDQEVIARIVLAVNQAIIELR